MDGYPVIASIQDCGNRALKFMNLIGTNFGDAFSKKKRQLIRRKQSWRIDKWGLLNNSCP